MVDNLEKALGQEVRVDYLAVSAYLLVELVVERSKFILSNCLLNILLNDR